MLAFTLILLLPAVITIAAKACGVISSNWAAAVWIIASGCLPALIYAAIMLTSGRPHIISSPIVVIVGIVVAWLGFAAFPAGWSRKR